MRVVKQGNTRADSHGNRPKEPKNSFSLAAKRVSKKAGKPFAALAARSGRQSKISGVRKSR